MNDLIILVADSNTRLAVDALLERTQALGIRRLDRKIIVHPGRDPGVVRGAAELLRPLARDYHFAITICDLHGCGVSAQTVWNGRLKASCIEPDGMTVPRLS